MSRMKWHRQTSRQWTPRTKCEPTPDDVKRAVERRERAKRGVVDIVKSGDGPPCPSCGNVTEMRTHSVITAKMKRGTYYTKWYYCRNANCRERAIFRDEDRSDVIERLAAITEQLKGRQ